MTRARALAIVVALSSAVLDACGASATAPCDAAAPALTGTWHYAAAQDAPSRASISGTMSLTRESCGQFEGSLDVVAVDVSGRSSRLAGPVRGTVNASGVARFDVAVGGDLRQHFGSFRGDSVAGNWLTMGASGSESGSFRVTRAAPR